MATAAVVMLIVGFAGVARALDGAEKTSSARMEGGRVTATFRAAPIGDALRALSEAAGVEVHWMLGEGDEVVSTRFEGASLADAVARLVPHRGSLLIAGGQARPQLWIGDVNHGRSAPRVGAAGSATPDGAAGAAPAAVVPRDVVPDALEEAQHHRRLDAVAHLAGRSDDPQAHEALLGLLADGRHPDVQAAAFASLRERGSLPTSAILAFAMQDGVPALRWAAVDVLRERVDDDLARAALEQLAGGDVDPAIQQLAREATVVPLDAVRRLRAEVAR
jgi:hypothetical protein